MATTDILMDAAREKRQRAREKEQRAEDLERWKTEEAKKTAAIGNLSEIVRQNLAGQNAMDTERLRQQSTENKIQTAYTGEFDQFGQPIRVSVMQDENGVMQPVSEMIGKGRRKAGTTAPEGKAIDMTRKDLAAMGGDPAKFQQAKMARMQQPQPAAPPAGQPTQPAPTYSGGAQQGGGNPSVEGVLGLIGQMINNPRANTLSWLNNQAQQTGQPVWDQDRGAYVWPQGVTPHVTATGGGAGGIASAGSMGGQQAISMDRIAGINSSNPAGYMSIGSVDPATGARTAWNNAAQLNPQAPQQVAAAAPKAPAAGKPVTAKTGTDWRGYKRQGAGGAQPAQPAQPSPSQGKELQAIQPLMNMASSAAGTARNAAGSAVNLASGAGNTLWDYSQRATSALGGPASAYAAGPAAPPPAVNPGAINLAQQKPYPWQSDQYNGW